MCERGHNFRYEAIFEESVSGPLYSFTVGRSCFQDFVTMRASDFHDHDKVLHSNKKMHEATKRVFDDGVVGQNKVLEQTDPNRNRFRTVNKERKSSGSPHTHLHHYFTSETKKQGRNLSTKKVWEASEAAASDCGTSTTLEGASDSILRCNSPFLDAIFGGTSSHGNMRDVSSSMIVKQHHPAASTDLRASWHQRQRLASSILQKHNVQGHSHSLNQPPLEINRKGGIRAWNSATTTTDSISDISVVSELVTPNRRSMNELPNVNDVELTMNTDKSREYALENQTRIMAPNVDRLTAMSM